MDSTNPQANSLRYKIRVNPRHGAFGLCSYPLYSEGVTFKLPGCDRANPRNYTKEKQNESANGKRIFYFDGAALRLFSVCPVWISSMIDTIKRPAPMSLVPFSCIRFKSCRPVASTNETLDSSTRISPAAVTRSQHFSSSTTHGPASLPSTTKQVALEFS